MAKEKLILFEFASCLVAQSRAGPSQIMWRDGGESAALGVSFHNRPDHFRSEALSPDSSSFVDGTKEVAGGNSSRQKPAIQSVLEPIGHRDSAYVPSLSHEIGNHAVALAELHILTP